MKPTGWFILIAMSLLLAIQNPGLFLLSLGVFVVWLIFRHRRIGRFPNVIRIIEGLFVDRDNWDDRHG